MEKSLFGFFLFVQAFVFAQVIVQGLQDAAGQNVLSSDTTNVTLGCACSKSSCDPTVLSRIYNCTNNQTIYTCDCETFFVGSNRPCYYNCSHNGTCYSNKTCDDIRSCYNRCDVNATCTKQVNGTYKCMCNEGFEGNGTHCEPEDKCEEWFKNVTCNETDMEFSCACGNDIYCCSLTNCTENCTECNFGGGNNACASKTHVGNMTCYCNTSCKEIDGNFTKWGPWSDCYGTCDVGTKNRTRNCTNPAPQYGGKNCTGDYNQTERCNLTACPVHGNFSAWSPWSDCNVTCGKGVMNRTRNCTNPAPKYGGDNCTGDYDQTERCNLTACPVHGNFSAWSPWSDCNVTCGKGVMNRTRNCTNPAPNYGGDNCTGDYDQTERCNLTACPVHGNFSVWSPWGDCNETCGPGIKSRTRNCSSPAPSNGGENCTGEYSQTTNCSIIPCPINGNFSAWSSWSECNVTCGVGLKIKTRNCSNPVPQYGGENCTGDYNQTERCRNFTGCPVNGNFSAWTPWSACSVTCGVGIKIKTRNCSNPAPSKGGANCTGDYNQTELCRNLTGCPGVAGYSRWSTWSSCSVTCGGGIEMRHRTCLNQTGLPCNGTTNGTRPCTGLSNCPVDGNFSDWSTWSFCSTTCGSGMMFSNRTCTPPQYGGANCTGPTQRSRECSNPDVCPGEEGFTPWTEWSECSKTCLEGVKYRRRDCSDATNITCDGLYTGSMACYEGPCPVDGGFTLWSSWPSCPGYCGSNFKKRFRTCTNPAPAYGGANCSNNLEEVQGCTHGTPCSGESGFTAWSNWTSCSRTCDEGQRVRTRKCKDKAPLEECSKAPSQEILCNIEPCPVNGGWSSWTDWSRCSSSCGSGVQQRKRLCSHPSPLYGGLPCFGKSFEYQSCVMPGKCPGDEEFSSWTSWSTCDKRCDYGKQNRTRKCIVLPQYPPREEEYCTAPTIQHINCFIKPCPIDGNFTGWSFWSACSTTCGAGIQKRTRTCTFPSPMYDGKDCIGERHQVQDCVNELCPGEQFLTLWSNWQSCSSDCEGKTLRNRSCLPEYNNCTGNNATAFKDCNTQLCDENGGWSAWTLWSTCDKECGVQQEHRQRYCNNPKPQAAGHPCKEHSEENTTCSLYDYISCGDIRPAGWSGWSWWTPCSKSCNNGERTRYRLCSYPPPLPGGKNCTGEAKVIEPCNTFPCPVDGNFTAWSPWTNCTVICGGGNQTRERNCTNPAPKHGGKNCLGDDYQRQTCNNHHCPIHGGLSAWTGFSFCSKPCNTGLRVRTRSCTNPLPMYNGRNCSCNNTVGIFSHPDCKDHVEESKKCHEIVCPPVMVEANIDFNKTNTNFANADLSFEKYLKTYIRKSYDVEHKPVVGVLSCNQSHMNNDPKLPLQNSFTCVIRAFFNASDGDQLPILRDILDRPYSKFSTLWMNSSDVISPGVNLAAVVMSSTSIQLNWSLPVLYTKFNRTLNGFIVFYQINETLYDSPLSFDQNDSPLSFDQKSLPPSATGLLLRNLRKFTSYRIVVSPTSLNGTGIPSDIVMNKTFEDVPSKGPKLHQNISSPTSSSLCLSWDALDATFLHGVPRGYCVFYKKPDEATWQKQEVSFKQLSSNITGLKPFTKYYVQVAAKTTPGCGVKSAGLTVTTREDAPSESPEDVTAHNTSSTSLFVQWKAVRPSASNGVIRGYNVTYVNPQGDSKTVLVTNGKMQVELTGLSIWTKYEIEVSAFTNAGKGPERAVNERTDEGTPSLAPVIVEARNTSSTSIYIKWNPIADEGLKNGKLLGYRIFYVPLSTTRRISHEDVPTTTTEYSLTGLFFYWKYRIVIGGFNRPGVGRISTRIVRTDEELPGRSPQNVRGVAETSTSISVKWGDVITGFVHGKLLGYNLTIRETKDLSKLVLEKTISPNRNEYYADNLKKYTKYTIWIRAINSKGHGKLNDPEGYQARTKEDAPDAAPSNIYASTQAFISIVKLEWTRIPEDLANGIIRGYYVEYTAVILNGAQIEHKDRVTQTAHIRGNRYARILKNLIPASTYEIRMYGYTIKNGPKSEKVTSETCRCPEYVNVNWWIIPPYTNHEDGSGAGGIFGRIVNMLINDMCGTCKNGHGKSKACNSANCNQSRRKRREVTTNEKNSLQDVLNNINNNVDISFPVQGNKYRTTYAGIYSYISVVESPGSVFFTVKNVPSTSQIVINSAVLSIPLLFLIMLLSGLAGIIIWGLERFKNPTSFHPSFKKGLEEGFWWAYISATTVGYGDRRPITIPGRIFAMIWILTGHAIITVLTGIMVNAVTLVLVTEESRIYGSKIAAIENSTEYGKAIRQNGKVVGYRNFEEVVEALIRKEVDGALLDLYATGARKDLFEREDIEFNRVIEYPSGYGIVLSGRLINSAPLANTYLNTKKAELTALIQNNTDIIRQKRNVVEEAKQVASGLFDATSSSFQVILYILLGSLTISVAGGLFWQFKYHSKTVEAKKEREKQLRSTSGFAFHKSLKGETRTSVQEHFQDLLLKLRMVRKRHLKELRQLPKMNNKTSKSTSLTRVRKMKASVHPDVQGRNNIALQDMDTSHSEIQHERSGESPV